MNPIVPSDEQRAAIFAPGSLAVRAGAGSGKTEVLARRFVALLAGDVDGIEPLSPEQIAAITFTEKATYDMKRRITEVLDKELAGAQGERAIRLGRARRLLALARISTIHAFCSRILRENPLEAGLDPDFQVLDEDQSRTLLAKNVEELMMAAIRRNDPGALHLAGARGLRSGTYRDGAIDIVAGLLTELHRIGKDAAWLRAQTDASCRALRDEATALGRCANQIVKLIEELRRKEPQSKSKAAQTLRDLESEWPHYRNVIESFSAASPRADLDVLRELCQALPDAKGGLKEQVLAIRSLLGKNGGRLGLEGELIELYGAQRAIQPTRDTCALVANIAEQIERIKRRDGVATFDDLLGHANRLLRDNESIAGRYRRDLRAILVDEYQDTDPVQDAIVRTLTEPRAEMPALAYFIVGDEKQSIYRFRGADVTVFARALRDAPRQCPLSENRRAVPNLLSFVNALSASVMRGASQPPQPFWVEWNDSHRLRAVRSEIADGEPSVEIMLWPGAANDSGEPAIALRRETEARAIARRCRDLLDDGIPVAGTGGELRPARPRDIVLLLRSFEDVSIYERALDDAGIRCYTVKGRGFFGCAEVLDIAELLTAVNDPDNSLALAAALRSPLFSLSDQCLMEIALHGERQHQSIADHFADAASGFDWLATGRDDAIRAWDVIRELRAMRERAPIVALIERALELTAFEAVMIAQSRGNQRAANIRKLVEMARDFESRHLFTLADFIGHLRRLTTDQPNEPQAQLMDENEDVMRLMTIHQAKGLEFPVVVVADLGRGAPNPERNYLLSSEHGLLLSDTVGSGHDELPHPLIERHKQRLADQEAAESARLLYVAITRARDRLILSEGPGNQGWRKKLRIFLGEHAIGAFLGSGDEQRALEIAGASIMIRRTHAIAEESRASDTASPPTADELELLANRARERLGFAPAPTQELTVSPTAMADFDRCPRQYLFRHRMGLSERDGFSDGGGNAIELGTVAHAVLESLDLELRGPELEAAIARALDACAGIKLVPAEQLQLGRDLRRYVESRPAGERVLAKEVPFFMHVAGAEISIFIRGQIDLLIDDGNGIVVRDYKYARRSGENLAHYQVPMECYRLAAADAYPERELRAELLFLRDRPEACELKLPSPEVSRDRILEIGRAMLAAEADGIYPKKPAAPDQCRRIRCGYLRRCWEQQA
ncbi:MAG: UvrD-helicase domain-containing protein [Candidatus Binataceae bacterium]|jgi:ATP-dependent helicase/nuclease subunit A